MRPRRDRCPGGLKLLMVLVLMVVTWLVVLPRLADTPAVSARIRWLEEKQVKPSAMFYTEVEALEPVIERLGRGESAQ